MTFFENKVALVTGAASGIGESCAKELASLGARVVVSDIDTDGADRVVSDITNAGGQAAAFKLDASSWEDNKAAVEFAVAEFGALHFAVNNAGIGGLPGIAGEIDLDAYRRIININLNGVMYGMRAQIPAMLEAGAEHCAIVNMASIHGEVGVIGNGAYTAAKHGVVGLTKNAAAEYGPQGLRINSIGPAYIDTPLLTNIPVEMKNALVERHPLGRLGKPEEIAKVTRFLLSDDASFMTGSYVLVDGGYCAL